MSRPKTLHIEHCTHILVLYFCKEDILIIGRFFFYQFLFSVLLCFPVIIVCHLVTFSDKSCGFELKWHNCRKYTYIHYCRSRMWFRLYTGWPFGGKMEHSHDKLQLFIFCARWQCQISNVCQDHGHLHRHEQLPSRLCAVPPVGPRSLSGRRREDLARNSRHISS